MDVSSIPVAELLPQGPEAIVIDALVEHSATRSVAVLPQKTTRTATPINGSSA